MFHNWLESRWYHRVVREVRRSLRSGELTQAELQAAIRHETQRRKSLEAKAHENETEAQ